MATVPQVFVGLGLAGGAGLSTNYLILGDPASLLGTAKLAPDTLLYDASADVHDLSCSRGSQRNDGPLISYDAGQAVITLVNQDGRYDPDNYRGPFAYASGWTATITAAAADTTHFTVSTADSLNINAGDWVRFSAVTGGYLVTGIGSPSGGNVTVTFTPAAPSLVSSGTAREYQSMLTPQVIIRVRAVWAGVSYPVWAGYVTSWDPQYTGPEASYCVLTATDGLGYLNQDGLRAELGSPVGANELSGARVNRILNSAGWPSGPAWRDLDTGNSVMTGTTLGGPPAAELQLTADSELGGVWMSAAGQAVFRERRSVLTDAVSVTSQAVFGSGAGELPYTDRDLETGTARLANQVTANSASVSDANSVLRYNARPFTRTDLTLADPADPLQWARLILYQNKDPEQWFSALTIDPRVNPAVFYPQVLGRDIAHRVTVRRRPPGMPVISRDCFIRGITHEYKTGYWRTRWVLQSAAKYSFFILGTGILGRDLLAF